MAVQNQAPVEAGYVNLKLMSRTEDTSAVGKVSLENTESNNINDIQKFTNQLAEISGTFEGDTTGNSYSSQVYVTDGIRFKDAIGILDAAAAAIQTDLTALETEVNDLGADVLALGSTVAANDLALTTHISDATIHFTQSAIDHTVIQNRGINTHAQIDSHIASTANPHATTKAQVGLGNVTDNAQLTRGAGDFNSFTTKTTPIAADIILIEDSADSFNKKKITLTDLLGGGGGGVLTVADITARDAIPAPSRTEGLLVYVVSVQKNFQLVGGILNANWRVLANEIVSSQLALTASPTLAIDLFATSQTIIVGGATDPVTVAAQAFGASAPVNGAEILLIGNSDINFVSIVSGTSAKNIKLNGGFIELYQYHTLTLKYVASLDLYLEISRSN